MKKILYSLVLFPGLLLAQPTIPLGDVPSPGEVIEYADMMDEPVITSGANQTWTIGGIADLGDIFSFLPPSLAPGNSNFPTATIAVADNSQEAFAFFIVTAGELSQLGYYDDPNALALVLTNARSFMKYPCTMGTQWTDTYQYPGNPIETISFLADGYGTLIAPGGSMNNVLKVRSTETYVDTMINGVHHEVLGIMHWFWRPGETFYIAAVYTTEERENGVLVELDYMGVDLKSSLAVGMEENPLNSIGVQARPNPATDRITLTFGAEGAVRIEVIDALGKVIGTPVQRVVAPGVSTEELNVQGWPAGQYCARITMANGDQGSVRFVVQ